MCEGPTIDLGCGPGRLVAHLVRRGIPALGVDLSATAVQLARRSGAPALRRDVFEPLPGTGRWQTVLLADGNVGLSGDPRRVLRRAAELLMRGGRCVAEFDTARPESHRLGPVGVGADDRAVVSLGLGRDRLRGRAGRGGRAGAGRRSTPSATGSSPPSRRHDGDYETPLSNLAQHRGDRAGGVALGVAVAICFLTGLISHFIQHPQPWFFWPTHPVWLYRLTQGLHVISGIAAIPLLVVKLWSVWPKLFERPFIGGLTRQLERLSILVLVASMTFQLSTGLLNIAQWYAFKFFFTTSHYAMAYVAAGAVIVHIGVKLPVIRRALGEPLEPLLAELVPQRGPIPAHGAGGTGWPWGWRRRHRGADGPLAAKTLGAGPAFGARPAGRPGQPLRRRRRGAAQCSGPGLPADGDQRRQSRTFSLPELAAMPQTTRSLPIACVEGWSADAEWTGIVLADLLAAVGASPDADVRMISLEPPGPYSRTVLPARHARDAKTLIALRLNGADPEPRPRLPVPADRPEQTRCAADEVALPHRSGARMSATRVGAADDSSAAAHSSATAPCWCLDHPARTSCASRSGRRREWCCTTSCSRRCVWRWVSPGAESSPDGGGRRSGSPRCAASSSSCWPSRSSTGPAPRDNHTVLDRNYPLGLCIVDCRRVGCGAALHGWSPPATSS